jgi:cytochrome c553
VTERGPDGMAGSAGGRRLFGPSWLGRPVTWLVIVGLLVALGVAVAVFLSIGGVDVSADKPDGWVTRHLLHYVFKRSEAARGHELTVPDDFAAPSRVRLAAQHFEMVCANCHGRPGMGQSVTALSMSPRPQYLPKVIDQFSDRELHQIVEHGVKFSAMPSWPTAARSDEVWSMVAFLRQLPRMNAQSYHAMTALPVKQDGGAGIADAWTLRPANQERDTPPKDEHLYAAPAYGFSDTSFHDNPATSCARCHGADGSGAATDGEAPNLTIQNAAYLQQSLEAYTRGSRKSGFMQTIAAQLTGAQDAALAHYYAGLTVKTVVSPPANPALVERGRTIATLGIRERAIPACANCHESSGVTITGAPHIAGQSATYLRRELGAIAHGGRGSTLWWNPMPAVAHDLGQSDIAAVAAYYASLSPVKSSGNLHAQTRPTAISWTTTPGALAAAKETFDTRCVKCHVNGGRGDLEGNYPDLTLQTQPYVAQTLYTFRTRARPNAKMLEIIDSLTFNQMTSLAAYVNTLTPLPGFAKPDAVAAQRGSVIAMRGIPAQGVPACLSCHGAKGVEALPLIPRLQGQNVAYLSHRLFAFSKPDAAYLSALNPMPGIARRLTDKDRADLAAYFAAAPPLQKVAAQP